MAVDCPSTGMAFAPPPPNTQYLGYFRLASTLNVTLGWFLGGHESITEIERSITSSSLPRRPTSNILLPVTLPQPSFFGLTAFMIDLSCYPPRL